MQPVEGIAGFPGLGESGHQSRRVVAVALEAFGEQLGFPIGKAIEAPLVLGDGADEAARGRLACLRAEKGQPVLG
jgi:hypothetical protein